MRWIALVLLLLLVAFYSCELIAPQYPQPIPQSEIDAADSLIMLLDSTEWRT